MKVLVAEDEPAFSHILKELLDSWGYEAVLAGDGLEAWRILRDECAPRVAVLDWVMPGMNGVEICRKVRSELHDHYVYIILLTGQRGEDNLIAGMEAGADDYILKPLKHHELAVRLRAGKRIVELQDKMRNAEEELRKSHDELELRVRERTEELTRANDRLAVEVRERKDAEDSLRLAYDEIEQMKDRLEAENIYLLQDMERAADFGEIIGNSEAIRDVIKLMSRIAPLDTNVLLLGETGTGKGVVARDIHAASNRRNRPMVTVNCSSLPANLIESELFGREKGAFTGAHARQIGRFELADGGTIFLDEIGEMPLELQPKLLRAIQDGEFERLGGPHTIKVNVRIIAATNRNLVEEVHKKRFREDLFYRLNVFPISIPPLRQRKDDIPLLVNHFIENFNKKTGKRIDSVSKESLERLIGYNWPGNVRELENIVERAVITSRGSVLRVLDRLEATCGGRDDENPCSQTLDELERNYILKILQRTGWRIEGEKGAATILGLNPGTLRGRMRKYSIHRE